MSIPFCRGWDKVVVVLFHGSWTQESQHAVGLMQHLAGRRHQGRSRSDEPDNTHDTSDRGSLGAATVDVVFAEADVMTLIDVADRQAIAALPSVHLHLGGREVVRFPVKRNESVESLGARIDEVASTIQRMSEFTATQLAAAAAAR